LAEYEEGREGGEKIGEEKGIKKGKIEMARAMKKKNYLVKEIVELTGLSPEDISISWKHWKT
jgi:predicted transposase/invertase (TIGR01784 family)